MTSKVVFNDWFPRFGISVDSKGTIADIQKFAQLYGGIIAMYDMRENFPDDYDTPYRISYRLSNPPFEFMIHSIEISKEHFELQKSAWNGHASVMVTPKTRITLIDNSYLIVNV